MKANAILSKLVMMVFLAMMMSACGGGGGGDNSPRNLTDSDADGIVNESDNCPNNANPDQKDQDGDGIGDVCDTVESNDRDGDGILDESDNCPDITNSDQKDDDGDGIGNVCDDENNIDTDGDGIANEEDNCPNDANPGQEDDDNDGLGNPCDPVAAKNSELDTFTQTWQPNSELLGKSEEKSDPKDTGIIFKNGSVGSFFDCNSEERTVTSNYENFPAWIQAYSELYPGTIVDTKDFQNGNLTHLPVGENRSVTLYVSGVSLPDSSINIENATTSGIKQGISELIQRIEDSGVDLPANIVYNDELTESSEQFYNSAGMSTSFGIKATDAYSVDLNFGDSKSSNTGSSKKYVVIKLVQPLFTINYDYSEKILFSDLFGEISEDVYGALKDGDYMNSDYPPAFVSSVTYGRMALFVIEESSTISSSDANQKYGLGGAYNGYGGDLEAGGTQSVGRAESEQRMKVIAVGGAQEAALTAIKTGSFDGFLDTQNASTAVPISFTVRHAVGNRPVLAVRETSTYTVTDCFQCEKRSYRTVLVGEVHKSDTESKGTFGGSCHARLSGRENWLCSEGGTPDTYKEPTSDYQRATRQEIYFLPGKGTNEKCDVQYLNSDPTTCGVSWNADDRTGSTCRVACSFQITAREEVRRTYPACSKQ